MNVVWAVIAVICAVLLFNIERSDPWPIAAVLFVLGVFAITRIGKTKSRV